MHSLFPCLPNRACDLISKPALFIHTFYCILLTGAKCTASFLERCISYIGENASECVKTTSFLNLSKDGIIKLISSDCVSSCVCVLNGESSRSTIFRCDFCSFVSKKRMSGDVYWHGQSIRQSWASRQVTGRKRNVPEFANIYRAWWATFGCCWLVSSTFRAIKFTLPKKCIMINQCNRQSSVCWRSWADRRRANGAVTWTLSPRRIANQQ